MTVAQGRQQPRYKDEKRRKGDSPPPSFFPVSWDLTFLVFMGWLSTEDPCKTLSAGSPWTAFLSPPSLSFMAAEPSPSATAGHTHTCTHTLRRGSFAGTGHLCPGASRLGVCPLPFPRVSRRQSLLCPILRSGLCCGSDLAFQKPGPDSQ